MASLTVTDRFKYDVFLSFRGEDTRHGFTSYLKKALDDKGVRTFMDDEELQKGEEITPSLLKAIEDSNMAIVVLSKNYASSSFCLQELSHILDSIKDKGRSVLPVFYKVDPSDVRKLKRKYGEAMDKHKANSNLDKWKVCLHQVADLSGFHYKKKGDMHEHKFIGEIVEKVFGNIEPVPLPVGDYKVGLEHQKQHVISLLNVGSDETVRMVGIHGIGGIGKTTLAISVYNLIANEFEVSCFVENVRENHEKHGLPYLQNIILSKVVGEKKELTGVLNGISKLGQMLQQKKLLLILDDVNELEQLEALAGKHEWFNRSSRIIITTRDKRLLTCHGVEKTYEMKGLNDDDAFDLVGWKALRNDYSPIYKDVLLEQKCGRELNVNKLGRLKDLKNDKEISGYANVLKRVVAYASGLPLALEVIGSHFFNRTIEQCNDALNRYERVPDKKIQTTLQLSFNALQKEEQFVFLDIACCLKGWNVTRVEKILHAHRGDIMKDHINVLVEKSLIKISESNTVTMHDLVEDMGKEIVRQESPEDPGKRSRLWAYEDVRKVFNENRGTSNIEIIHLPFNWSCRQKWDGEAFKKMENLKTLIIMHADFSQKPKHLPNSLRVLECSNPFEWEGFLTKKFENMRVLNLYRSYGLTQIPDISGLPNLEVFSIQNCETLTAIDKSVGFLRKLEILRFISCTGIKSIPPLSLASLEILHLSYCDDLESFPLMVDGFVGKLKILRVISCKKIRIIPSLMLASSLEELDLSDCTSLESFEELDLSNGISFERSKGIDYSDCASLQKLEELDLSDCVSFESFEELDYSDTLDRYPHVVYEFRDKHKCMSFKHCIKLRSIPPLKLDLVETLDLSNCFILENFPIAVDGFFEKLKTLLVKGCHSLRNIPSLKLDSLETLDLSYCYSLESFPLVLDGFLGKLKTLLLEGCRSLKSIPPLKLDLQEKLDLSYCESLESFPLVVDGLLGKLKTLLVRCCYNLKSIPPLKLDSLETLDLSHCHSLENFPIVVDGSLGKLKTLLVKSCHNVRSIPPFKLDLLETLDLSCCYSLESFPLVVDGLWKLVLDDCKELQEIKVIPPCLRILSARNCMSLTSSCKSKLLNQELHKAGNTWFRLPHAKVPEWFDHQWSAGLSISFWFRNKFPAIALCVLSQLTWDGSPLRVIINGNTFFYTHGSKIGAKSHADTYHLHLFHMQMENFNDDMDKALFESKWNHAEVYFGFEFHESGIHVLKEKSNMKDVRFTNPENDANIVLHTRDVEVMLPPEPFNLPTELSLTSEEIEPLPNNLHLSSSSIRHISHKNVSNQTEQIQCLSSSEKFLDNQESKAHGRKNAHCCLIM